MRIFSIDPLRLSIVIPAYNEADNIPIVINDTITTLDASGFQNCYELILINDGSTDDSRRVVDEMVSQYPCVKAFHHQRNMGLGEGIKTGFKNSRGEFLTFIPADGEVKVDQVIKLLAQLGDADMMTSDRLGYIDGSRIRQRSIFRGVLSWGYRLCIRMILGCSPQKLTGIYLVRGDIVRSLSLHSQTSLVSLEIYMHCLYSGAKMKHGEITICPRLSGVSKIANLSGAWKQLWEMFLLRQRTRHNIQKQCSINSRAA